MFIKILNFVKSHVAILISLISLCLSLYNFLYLLISRKCKIKIIVNSYLSANNIHQFFVTIQNRSQLPVSISSISLNNNHSCELEPKLVRETTRRCGSTIISRTETRTFEFPINLNSLEGISGYLEFKDVQNFDKAKFFFTFFTNRRPIKTINFNLNDVTSKNI